MTNPTSLQQLRRHKLRIAHTYTKWSNIEAAWLAFNKGDELTCWNLLIEAYWVEANFC